MSNTTERPEFKAKYNNYINGKFTAPLKGKYLDVISVIDGKVFTQAAHSGKEDLELAVEAAYEALRPWQKMSVAERSILLNKIAKKIEDNIEYIKTVQTLDNSKLIHKKAASDIALAIDHFRYFAGLIRTEEILIAQLDSKIVSIVLCEPLSVVTRVIPWNFPILLAVWKIAPALAAGNTIVLKTTKRLPISILVIIKLIGAVLPPGVLNIVNGLDIELTDSLKANKTAFGNSSAEEKIPDIYYPSVADHDDDFFDKAIEGAVLFALNHILINQDIN
ncbi:aldehyde dehydrogenase family protein [Flavobacterium pectinovorum]|uniref:Aldehyde dehydrogenase family protein n=1 Tax=Flavobacterium pectinovorum TaxID=29533 RepID=A0AB36P283_9FLAO|nr:aldehyde dehydrogenase family protein [Flavobacterium pectinovorum]OXB03788.1 hypothetical protein B0A72_14930 [Flavobacterium pectinovorum]SHL67807.1 Aldehyde dehydrogenase family protein [Flavobacterium pectinovorum]